MKLTLRDLFWFILLMAAVAAWWTERERKVDRIAAREAAWPHLAWRSRPAPSVTLRHVRLNTLAYLSDDALVASFNAIVADNDPTRYGDFDVYLWEMQRRKITEPLDRIHRTYMQRKPTLWTHSENLALLTALRRAQGKSDPLRIVISLAKAEDRPLLDRTELSVALTNVDSEGAVLLFDVGGDYRGGRREKWRVRLIDEWGRQVPDSNFMPLLGGGFGGMQPLEAGKSHKYPIKFDIRRYVSATPSGRYYLQAFFHSREYIARERDLTGLVVAQSDPIPVTVINRANLKSEWFPARVRPIVAILAAAALWAAISCWLGPARRGFPGRETVRLSIWQIMRLLLSRDIAWATLIVGIAFFYWQDLTSLDARLAHLKPDADADWSIRLGH